MIDGNNENIEGELIKGIEEGSIELSGVKDGDLLYSITKDGEAKALEQIGGKDVSDVAWWLVKILHDLGDAFGNKHEDSFSMWLIMVQIARLWKEYSDISWEEFVAKVRGEILENKI